MKYKLQVTGLLVVVAIVVLFVLFVPVTDHKKKIIDAQEQRPQSSFNAGASIQIKVTKEHQAIGTKEKNDIKTGYSFFLPDQNIVYRGPKGKNIDFRIVKNGNEKSIQLPIGDVNLSKSHLIVDEVEIPLDKIGKIEKSNQIKAVLDSKNKKILALYITTKTTKLQPMQAEGDLPSFYFRDRDINESNFNN